MKTHRIKTWPPYFSHIVTGKKTFQFRKNDRDYQVGDTLVLEEWDPENQKYTDRHIEVKVQYIVRGPNFGIPEDYCIMGLFVPCVD